MIQLLDKHKRIVMAILSKYPYHFYVFGSRAKGTAKPFSDLDLAVKENMQALDKTKIITEFEESDLPFKIDLIEMSKIDPSFKAHILSDLILLE
jgi:predicted nucleotidyltransferase